MARSPWAWRLCINELEAWYQTSGTRGGEKKKEWGRIEEANRRRNVPEGSKAGAWRSVAVGSIFSHARAAAWTKQPSLIKPSSLNCLGVGRARFKIDTSIPNTVRWDGDDSAYILTPRPPYFHKQNTEQMADKTHNIRIHLRVTYSVKWKICFKFTKCLLFQKPCNDWK